MRTQSLPVSAPAHSVSDSHLAFSTRLIMAGVGLLLLLVAVLLSWWLWSGRQVAEQRALADAVSAARLLEQRTLSSMREVDLLLDDVAREAVRLPIDPPVEWSEPLGFETILMLRDKPGRLPHVVVVSVLDARGRIAYSTSAARGADFSSLPIVARVLAQPKPQLYVSGAYQLRVSGREGVAFARPVFGPGGRLQAIVLAGVHIEAWLSHLDDLHLGASGLAYVADREQHLVAAKPLPNRQRIGRPLPDRQLQPSGLGEASQFFHDASGARYLLVQRQLSDYPFSLGVALAEDDYLATWRQSAWVAALGLLFLIVFGSLLLLLLWRGGRQARALSQSEARLSLQEQRMRRMVEASPCALGLLDFSTDHIRYLNPDMADLVGRPVSELAGQPMASLFAQPEDWAACRAALREAGTVREREYALHTSGGTLRWVDLSATLLAGNGGGDDVLVSMMDVTQRVAREHRLSHEAGTDALTGLANRRRFLEQGGEMFELAHRHQRPLALLMIDLDHFKQVNDLYGHGIGDEVLVRMARLLDATLRTGDLAVRLGGEEFVALLPETDLTHALEAAERLREAVENAPLMLADSRLLAFTVSIGVAALRDEHAELHNLLAQADAALYRAKHAGRNRVTS